MQTIRACSSDLIGEFVSPDKFVYYPASLYAEVPFPLQRYSSDDEIEWVCGYDMTRRTPVWVPLGVVLNRYTSTPHSAPNWCPDSIFPHRGRGDEGFGDGQV